MSELHLGDYIQSGFIILNNVEINRNGLVPKFKQIAKRKLKYQDQDTLNIVCYGKIYYLSLEYNMTDYSFYYSIKERDKLKTIFNSDLIENALKNGNLHFNGHKPWKKYCINFDIWWEYYRKSPFFDKNFYYDFYNYRLTELDRLPLIKRIKILIRYFLYGQYKG
jgi:lipopolysaccharide biosynthesis glycosyltransferase